MNYLFVPYELYLLAQEKGYPDEVPTHEICGFYCQQRSTSKIVPLTVAHLEYNQNAQQYSGNYGVAPLYQQLVDWFLSKHDINIWAMPSFNAEGIIWFGGIFRYSKNGIQSLTYLQDKDISPTFNDLGLAANEIFKSPTEAIAKALEEAFKLI